MLEQDCQTVPTVHTPHRDISRLSHSAGRAERHYVHAVAHTACVVDVVGEGF